VSVSAIPAALDALLTLARAAAEPGEALDGVHVCDALAVSAIEAPSTVLIIGGNAEPGDPLAASSELADAGLGRGDDLETFDITCHVEHWRGGDQTREARLAAFAVVDVVDALLVADQTLGGVVARARVTGALDLAQTHYKGDTGAAIPFVVRCQAFR
jgi:hypothetical protein